MEAEILLPRAVLPMTSPESPATSMVAAQIPTHLTRFVGRDHELAVLARLLHSSRLLTLTGAGGSGKTRLAQEMALRASDAFERIGWVDLAPIGPEQPLAQHVATAMEVPERADTPAVDALVGSLRDMHTLIVLDNCEHIVDECAALVQTLLRKCPRAAVLATSREALGVASETAWLVPPLASNEAVQLFVERARASLPSFALTPANTSAVEEICRRLDGIPLAIELAAARVRVLSPEQIARRLDDAFRLLTTGSRTALARHRTLRATMEWSYALLGAREQVLLRRLAIFSGSFTLDAAEVVCVGEASDGGPLEVEDILDGVSTLVDKSLVTMAPGDGEARYSLLETVRQYGAERMKEAGEYDAVSLRYVEHYLAMMEAAEPSLVGGSAPPLLMARLVAEQDNLRAASHWAVGGAGRSQVGLRFAAAMYWFWYAVGQMRESRDVTNRAIALDDGSNLELRGRALVSSALAALFQGDYAVSRDHFEEAIPLLRAAGDAIRASVAMGKLGGARMLAGDLDAAVAILDDTLEFVRDRPDHDIAVIFARFWRGWTAYRQGMLDQALAMITPIVATGRQYNLPTTLGHGLTLQASIQLARGEVEEACNLVSESLEIEVANADAWGIGLALEVIAFAAARRGHHEDATRLLAGVEAHRERLAAALPGLMPAERGQVLASLREAVGARFDALYAEGRELSTPQVVALGMTEAARHTTEHRMPVVADRGEKSDRVSAARLRVLALGPLQVFVDGQLVESTAWGSARPRELLVYLLMYPEGRTKEQVGLAFWPDASPAQLRNSFHVTLHRLRKALGGSELVTLAHERYRIDPALLEEFDVAVFERDVAEARRSLKRQEDGASVTLEQALSRFRGDFLDGEPVGDWHLEHRDRFQRIYVDALMELGARLTKEERFARAADAYRRVLARDELHEEALLALMKCYAGLGERTQALRVYRRFADRMKQELDAEPDEETTALFESLQRGASV